MIINYINSARIIDRIEDEYNIQSFDYVARFPNWVINCLRDIRVKQIYQQINPKIEFENYKCKLPENVNKVYKVYINGVRAKLDVKETLKFAGSEYTLVSGFDGKVYGAAEVEEETIVVTPPSEPNSNSGITIPPLTEEEILANFAKNRNFQCYQEGILYRIENGWITTNVSHGEIEIIAGAFPYQLDESYQALFPVIPDDENLINAITSFVLKTILMRGYKHHLLSLEKDNEFLNPSIAYTRYKQKARNTCNAMSADAKDRLSKIINTNII